MRLTAQSAERVAAFRRAREVERVIAQGLAQWGYTVTLPPLRIAKAGDELDAWLAVPDLRIGQTTLEVKERDVTFWEPADWPEHWPDVSVDTVKKYRAKPVLPVAYVIVSKWTKAIAWVPTVTNPEQAWTKRMAYDKKQQRYDEFYFTDRKHLHPWSALPARLGRPCDACEHFRHDARVTLGYCAKDGEGRKGHPLAIDDARTGCPRGWIPAVREEGVE